MTGMPLAKLLLSLSLLWLLAGCAAGTGSFPRAEAIGDPAHKRLLSVCERFRPLIGTCCYDVMESSEAGAFAWPNGRIVVTRGLIEMLNDAELAAAVAHEIGHLLADGHISGPFSLRGSAGAEDAEVRADVLGVELLAATDIPAESMASMLEKLSRAPGVTDRQRAAVTARMRRIRHSIPSSVLAKK